MPDINVKILGAGSIGCHLAQASRRAGWKVTVVDINTEALRRMQKEIYPSRYGKWDTDIQLCESGKEPFGGFDIIMIGTPPDVRLKLALKALEEKPKILQLEKPLCSPQDEPEAFFREFKSQKDTIAVVGYDNALLPSIAYVVSFLEDKNSGIGEVLTIDVEFREHWAGIFAAHPWLKGPEDSYLGYLKRGGGAACEHSHALHLWQLLARASGLGRWNKVSAAMDIKEQNGACYDCISSFSLVTDKGKIGRVIQDVITAPTKKYARIQGSEGFIEWVGNGDPKGDIVRWGRADSQQAKVFEKTRPDDFYAEILHIQGIMQGSIRPEESPISLESGVQVMKVIKLAHRNRNKGMVSID